MYYESPVGWLKINIDKGFINEIIFCDEAPAANALDMDDEISKEYETIFQECKQQFDEYFAGERKVFTLPVKQSGTSFQETVWNHLSNIPYGHTISYLQLAKRVGNVKSIRAVGTANGKNNLPIVVPCHRVIGSNGTLVGYAGGLWRKQWLLEHENKHANGVQLLF